MGVVMVKEVDLMGCCLVRAAESLRESDQGILKMISRNA